MPRDFQPLIVINVFDRLTCLQKLVGWLETAGYERLVLLDNGSTYPPLVEYLAASAHDVVRLDRNHGSRALWAWRTPSDWFVYTDPDVLPIDDCPTDAVDHLKALLDERPEFAKAGLGLYLDDVPPSLPSLAWERSLVSVDRMIRPGVYSSLIDTTFALYRPNTTFLYEAIRTGHPYQCRHASWYVTDLDDEHRYYLQNALRGEHGSSWAAQEADHWLTSSQASRGYGMRSTT